MSPEEIIRRLSKRYGVSEVFGHRLKHLIHRALESEPPARKRIMDLVERSYAHEAVLERARSVGTKEEQAKALGAVAAILHDWNPPAWLDLWTEGQGPAEEG